MPRYRVHMGTVTMALLLVTWPHFCDPPSGSRFEARDDPRVGSALQHLSMVAFSLYLDYFLPLAFIVISFVSFLGVFLSVAFLFCVANACKWQLLHDHGRTRTKTLVLVALLLTDATCPKPRPQYLGGQAPTPVGCASPVPEFGDYAITASYADTKNMEHAGIRRMLLIMAGLEQ